MSPIMRSTALVLVACLLVSTACAHDITKILDKESDYSTFNKLLKETGLAKEINGRKTITVLAVPNDAIGDLSGKPQDVIKNTLKVHVILDYYDTLKLANIKGKSTKMTTLFQSTGVAHYSQGFLNVTQRSDGVYFGSAVKDAQRDAKLTGSVYSQPYNISVLSISHPIDTPGMDAMEPVSAPPPKKAKAPSPDVAESPEETVEGPTPEEAPAPGPEADKSDAPAASPKADADSDTADDKQESSSPGKLFVSTLALAAVLASCFAAL